MRRFPIAGVACIVCLVTALSGCSLAGDAQPDDTGNEFESDEFPGTLTFSGLEQSMLSKVDEYHWPADYYLDVPAQIKVMGPNGENTLFELGRDDVILSIANSCAWMEEWSNARSSGDIAAADAALSVIEGEIPELPAFADAGNSGAPFADMVADARLGNPEPINRYMAQNCSSLPWIPNPGLGERGRVQVSIASPERGLFVLVI